MYFSLCSISRYKVTRTCQGIWVQYSHVPINILILMLTAYGANKRIGCQILILKRDTLITASFNKCIAYMSSVWSWKLTWLSIISVRYWLRQSWTADGALSWCVRSSNAPCSWVSEPAEAWVFTCENRLGWLKNSSLTKACQFNLGDPWHQENTWNFNALR